MRKEEGSGTMKYVPCLYFIENILCAKNNDRKCLSFLLERAMHTSLLSTIFMQVESHYLRILLITEYKFLKKLVWWLGKETSAMRNWGNTGMSKNRRFFSGKPNLS